MNRNKYILLSSLLLLANLYGTASAVPISVSIGTAPYAIVDTFTLPDGEISGIYSTLNTQIAESFAGQTVVGGSGSTFEAVTGSPTNPISLLIPSAQDGVYITLGRLAGLADGVNADDIGEGMISMLFALDQSSIGFGLVGGNGGSATLDFFGRDGTLIDSVIVSGLADQDYTFASSGALFAGISITNTDPAGIAIDNFRISQAVNPVPEPTTLLLLGIGLTGLAGYGRKKFS